MQSKILRNIFVSLFGFLAFAMFLNANTTERFRNFTRITRSSPHGTFTGFDPAGSTFTSPQGINAAGTITGSYSDASGTTRGFIRAGDRTITTFDVPDAAFGTIPSAINPAGTIAGYYFDADFIGHSFLRAADGTFTTFDVPGAVFTQAVGINPSGTTTGVYCDADFSACHSFVRAPDGTLATFDPAMSPNLSGVINPAGAVTGTYSDGLSHGFVRAPNGTVTTFDAPDACETVNGTAAFGINPAGLVVGTIGMQVASTPMASCDPRTARSPRSMFLML